MSEEIQKKKNCLFCKIVAGEEEADLVYENDDFIVIKDKFPSAPVDLLVMPKKHLVKHDTLRGKDTSVWKGIFQTIHELVEQEDLWDNYQVLVNAPGMGHFHHEHVHVVSGRDLIAK